ncbi:dihydrolipoyl dehydrogenase [Oceanobacillus caeni]|uniref:dihydrolipoyl dehydrogenase n=1 Tax=Oceanobacillus TaxID=182709 RepID=UPI000621E6C3|nr:dihydrolipoyl dehydrogenase [Oceanobacillus caeni]KKE80678.1 dihydrolipoamide dehydrogenase [Bacilli bacterium VT-13-104]PZD84701.1 dihydrolipoyl dehydrogenase [Bacilli bacterium]MCR1834417.1 dihydrolipoyl dehydrogenase [Oceanobacillus caeni]PZD85296.1 dihydrolipoyl dehydrogenase [Bacilli bacterium]PZD92332.1 dihydrolipoyl dehydrogenase [Bacilli bacterium]
MSNEYDVVILGGGTGGYVAAIRASQLGMKVAIVEKEKLGGTCLHRGCIPTKALLRSAEVYQQTKRASEFGIETENTTFSFWKVQERKSSIIDKLHTGVKSLMKKNKIDVYHGFGRILGPSIFSPLPGTISIEYKDGSENTILIPKYVIIATGSKPKMLPGLNNDGDQVLNSDEILSMDQLPKSIIIVGAGVIGVEWASMLSDFNVHVTLVEYLNRILPNEDDEITKEVEKRLSNKGVTILKETKILPETLEKNKDIKIMAEQNGEKISLEAEKILVSVGRTANIKNIGLENTEITIENSYIQTNKFYQTEESHIYAIGDVIGGLQLAHVASHEGIVAIDHIANKQPLPINYEHVPSCVYSNPEVASIGLTEREARDEKGFDIKVGKFPFSAVGKALVYGETDGFTKIISDNKTNDILGIHLVGPHVTDLISEASLAKILDATAWEIGQTIHPHPTLSEVIGEAALAVDGFQIHR